MNKGFSFYFKKSWNTISFVLKKKNFLDRVILAFYVLLSLLGKIIFFTRPIFQIADNNLMTMIHESHDYSIAKAFDGISIRKRYLNLLISNIVLDLSLVVLAAIAVLPPMLLNFTVFREYYPYLLSIPFYVIAAIGALMIVLTFDPLGFVASKDHILDLGDYFYLSKEGTRKHKGTVFVTYFLCGLLEIITLIPLGVGFLLLTMYHNLIVSIIFYALIIVVLFLFIFLTSLFTLTRYSSLYLLYKDTIDLNHVIVAKKDSGNREVVSLIFEEEKEDR